MNRIPQRLSQRPPKLEREQIPDAADHSFHLLLTPGLNDQFYWHFHPEFEIVYVEADTGFRHIGDHISRFEGSDLVLIGSYVPHLNFDYGVTTTCEQVVLQMKPSFVGMEFFNLPEMRSIRDLFDRTKGALAFKDPTRAEAGVLLRQLPKLDAQGQLMQLLKVLALLSASGASEVIEARPVNHPTDEKTHHRLAAIHRYVEEHFKEVPDVHAAAAIAGLSLPAFCRYFRKATGLTFTDYVNKFRINQARKLLLLNWTVTETCYECGFGNLSHFNRTFRKFTGDKPSALRYSSERA